MQARKLRTPGGSRVWSPLLVCTPESANSIGVREEPLCQGGCLLTQVLDDVKKPSVTVSRDSLTSLCTEFTNQCTSVYLATPYLVFILCTPHYLFLISVQTLMFLALATPVMQSPSPCHTVLPRDDASHSQ